jgi:hypothetical protein
MRKLNKKGSNKRPSNSYGKKLILTKFICRIIIISCTFNVLIQMTYDIYKFATSSSGCDPKIQDSIFWTEFLWLFSRLNACIFWMIPFLYIFMPPSFLKTLCDKNSKIKYDSDEEEEEETII